MTPRTTIQTASRYQKRQNQTLRRAITSSCCSALSAPNRLGQGMNQRNTMSTRPRNAITSTNVHRSAHGTLRPAWEWNQTNAAGLVRTATMVAARVSLRRSRARPELPAPPGANRRTGSSLAIRQVYWWTFRPVGNHGDVFSVRSGVDWEGVCDDGDAASDGGGGGDGGALGTRRRGGGMRGGRGVIRGRRRGRRNRRQAEPARLGGISAGGRRAAGALGHGNGVGQRRVRGLGRLAGRRLGARAL